jgi:predicted O-methyltransferase YrrM
MGSNISINKEIEKYINTHSLKLNSIQKEIISYNEEMGEIKKMQIAISQCHFLHLLIKVSKVKKILEIGTFTGLSTLSMSLALPDDGKIITLDKNSETNKIAFTFFKKANQENKIEIITVSALEKLKNLNNKNEKFDLIFIDADKANYKNYYEHSLNLINKNDLIAIDNTLWYGDVVDETKKDKITLNIREFNTYVNKDSRTENIILPLGDGLSVCRKL